MGIAGECDEDKESLYCWSKYGKTKVTVHEYRLEWRDDVCVGTETGAEDRVEVDQCSGARFCDP